MFRKQELTQEGQTAEVVIYATFTDGQILDVTGFPGIDVSTTAPQSIAFTDPSATQLIIPYGAISQPDLN